MSKRQSGFRAAADNINNNSDSSRLRRELSLICARMQSCPRLDRSLSRATTVITTRTHTHTHTRTLAVWCPNYRSSGSNNSNKKKTPNYVDVVQWHHQIGGQTTVLQSASCMGRTTPLLSSGQTNNRLLKLRALFPVNSDSVHRSASANVDVRALALR